jgi:hypothetical protein
MTYENLKLFGKLISKIAVGEKPRKTDTSLDIHR